MKALVYTGPQMLSFQEAPEPTPGDGEVVIRVESVGICGSDMHAYLGHDERRPAPLILGHEAAGTIISGPQAGRRVTVNPLVTCMECEACLSKRENLCARRQIISMQPREGAFAQYVAMPPRNLVTVPDAVSTDQAALAEPIACGWHGVRLAERVLDRPMEGIRTLVLGGGAIGVGAGLSLMAFGVKSPLIIEPNQDRRQFLIDKVGLNAHAPDELAPDMLFDLVVDAVGFATTRTEASNRARAGGVIVHIGLGEPTGGLNIRRMTLQEITFIGTYTYTAQDFRDTAAAIFDGRLGSLDWIERRPLDDGAAAFADLMNGAVKTPKIILKPH